MKLDILNREHPMASARIVRMERHAWPGGYPLMLVTDDGGILCATCVSDNFGCISYSYRNGIKDGWYPTGMMNGGEIDTETECDNCGIIIVEAHE